MVNFFIHRPIFAIVLALVVMLAGLLSIPNMPVEQYPDIAPTSVSIRASYPGASAKTVEDSVTQVIEQHMTGLDNMLYLSSTSDNSGVAQITLTFAAGTNPDIAQVQVQNKLQTAIALLPQAVQQQGLQVTKSNSAFLMVAAFVSTDGSMDKYDLADYVAAHVQDPVSRVNGVGALRLFGSQYAMRIWLEPNKLYTYHLTPVDVVNAIRGQNVQVSSGQLGGQPAVDGQKLTAPITSSTRLKTPEQFRNILLRVNADGAQVRLGDVARVALGGENYNYDTKFNGQPTTGLAIQLASGANALKTAAGVRAKIAELSQYFPRGMKVVYPYDTTPFVRLSIEEVITTLLEGICLVILVVMLFMQNWRATLIPGIAVPVVLLGTFAIMHAFGFTINTLTLFALVLVIGLLVDDAIVVVENVERTIHEDGLAPMEATKKAMQQITGALVGIATVLCAVFVPMAFVGGAIGAIYRQFSLTIVAAMLLSVLVAMILSPTLCARLLKGAEDDAVKTRGFFGWFNRMFERARRGYLRAIAFIIGRKAPWLMVYAAVLVGVGLLFYTLPTSFLPDEDQGIVFILAQTPAGTTQQQTQTQLDNVVSWMRKNESDTVLSAFAVAGFSFAGRGQNTGMIFVRLRDWGEREAERLSASAFIERLKDYLKTIRKAKFFAVNPPPIPRLGNASGFDMELVDRAALGHDKLVALREKLIEMADNNPVIDDVHANGLPDGPQYKVNMNREKALALGLSPEAIDRNFSIIWAGTYVNDFIDRGRMKKVYVQGAAPYRMMPDDIGQWYARNQQGNMVPYSAFASGHWTYGSPRLERYNGASAFQIQGKAAEGKSSGEAMAVMEQLVAKLGHGVGLEWTGMSYQEKLSGSQAPFLYALSVLVVFLALAALYESWSIPFSVILVVPLGIFGALLATTLRGLENDVYFQVALLTTVGLSAKNAILIVEFATLLQDEGKSAVAAVLEACRVRLRPIMMTSLAFILGVLPLAISSGAGSASQHAIGTGVIGGMLSATFLAIFMVPLFYVLIRERFGGKSRTGASHD